MKKLNKNKKPSKEEVAWRAYKLLQSVRSAMGEKRFKKFLDGMDKNQQKNVLSWFGLK